MTELDYETYTEEGQDFIVFETHYGLFSSRDHEGNGICSSYTKEDCIFWSREHINGYKNSTSITTNVTFQGQDMLK